MRNGQAARKPGTDRGNTGGWDTGGWEIIWRGPAIFLVKLIHSLIFLSVAVSILHIFYAGVTNRPSRITGIALALALGESLIFALNRWNCPLRTLAEAIGAESGQVTDIFLPKWFADRIPWFFTPPLVIGLVGLLWRRAVQTGVPRDFSGDVH